MTAASGGNRESLLGPRPARRKQSAADAGCRNPGSGSALALTERLFLINGKAAAGEKAPAAVPPAMMPVI